MYYHHEFFYTSPGGVKAQMSESGELSYLLTSPQVLVLNVQFAKAQNLFG